MRYRKDVAAQSEEAGFSLDDPGRTVCPNCIGNSALMRCVSRHAQILDCCDFCGERGPNGHDLQELFRYMSSCIRAEWGDSYHQSVWDGGTTATSP